MAAAAPRAHDPYAAFRGQDFRRYLAGNFIFLVGLQMQKVAIGWEVYERTGSAIQLGYVGLAQFAPQVVFVLFAGHVADTYSRKRVLVIAVLFNLLAALGLAWNSAYPQPLAFMYALLLTTGTARAFWTPARSAILPRIVPIAIFSNAVSWNTSVFEVASVAGPAIGGLFIGAFHRALPVYVVNAVAGGVFVLLLARVRYTHEPGERKAVTFAALSAGAHFIARMRVLFGAIILDTFAVLLGGATALMPIYAKDILHVGPRGLGWLLAAPSVGAFSMALVQAHRGPLRRAGRTLLWSVAGFGVVTILFGLSRVFWFSLVMLVALGTFDNISVVLRSTLAQVLTPDDMRGRVSALNGLFVGTSNELGAFESGLTAQIFGAVLSVVSGGIGTLIVVAAVAWLFPELRQFGRLDQTVDP